MVAQQTPEAAAVPCLAVPLPIFASIVRQLADYRAREAATRAYLDRGDMDPGPKLLAYKMARELGIAPGSRPNVERPQEYKPVCAKWLARDLHMNEQAVGAWLTAFSTPAEGYTPIFRRVPQDAGRGRTVDQQTDEIRTFTKVVYAYAPPEGRDFADTWGQAATMAMPTTTKRHVKLAEDAAKKAEKARETLREAQEIVAQWTCARCQHEGLELHARCPQCGESRPVAAMTDAGPRPRGGRSLHAAPSLGAHPPGDGAGALVAAVEGIVADSATTREPVESVVAESATTLVGAAAGGELAAAVAVIAPAVLPVTAHVTMDRRQFTGEKYKDVKAAPTEALVAAHLQGPTIRGSGLCWDDPATTSGRAARAIAWDSDDALGRLVASAGLLRRRGLRPLLVKNPSKPSSGHLWLFLDANVDPTDALARAEEIAPELRTVRERFPDPETGGGRPGGRLRWPGGRYLPAEGPPVAVLVALAPEVGAPAWIAGDTPAGWAVIAGAVSHAPDLLVTWVDPARRPQRPRPRRAPMARPVQRGNASGGADGHGDVFKTFKVRYTVPDLVEVLPGNMFRSPWHADSSASCHLLADGGWYDHSRKRSGDAVALWCALHGYWPDGAEKPDYKAARPALAQHLGLTAQGAGT